MSTTILYLVTKTSVLRDVRLTPKILNVLNSSWCKPHWFLQWWINGIHGDRCTMLTLASTNRLIRRYLYIWIYFEIAHSNSSEYRSNVIVNGLNIHPFRLERYWHLWTSTWERIASVLEYIIYYIYWTYFGLGKILCWPSHCDFVLRYNKNAFMMKCRIHFQTEMNSSSKIVK